jgi:hypothetical protein
MNASSAQPAAILLSRDHQGIGASAQIRCAAADKDTLRLAIDTYGFLIARNESLSLQAFAERIASHYDRTSPRNAEIIASLERAHALNEAARTSALTPLAA